MRRPGEVLRISALGAYNVKWIAVDIKGNRVAVKTQRLLVAATRRRHRRRPVPATLSLSLGAPASFGPFTPGVTRDYTAATTANVISTAGNATLSVVRPEHGQRGPPGQRHVRAAAEAAGDGVEPGRHGRRVRRGGRRGRARRRC